MNAFQIAAVVTFILFTAAATFAIWRMSGKKTNQAAPIKREEFILHLATGTAILELPAAMTEKDKERILAILDGIVEWPEGQKHVMGR